MSSKEDAKLLSMFAKTRTLIKPENRENRENEICTIALDGAEHYCNAILLLLNKNYVFPAKALMRCLCELTVKLMWCLSCSGDVDEGQCRETVDEKAQRWEKSTNAQNIKVLKDWKRADPQNSKVDEQIREREKKKDNMNVKEMPHYTQLLVALPEEVRSKMSLQLYMGCHNAIHLDTNSLVEIHFHNNKTNVNDSDISGLKDCCFVLVKLITGVIAINKSS